jgi:flagellar biosynthetic protein FliO
MKMTPAADALAAAPDVAPSLLGAALRTAAVLVLLGAAAWVFLRWHRGVRMSRRQMEVLDRAVLARGASVVILRVEGERLLLGVSTDGVRLLRDLDSGAPGAADFKAALAGAAERGVEP